MMSVEQARAADAADPVRTRRGLFSLPKGVIYLDGNSLGALPRSAPERVAEVLSRQWGEGLIRSWNSHDWIGAPQRLGARIAPLLGAQAQEVIVTDSTSVNLFKLLTAGALIRPGRRVILSEPGNFPTDLYVARGVEVLGLGVELRTVPRDELAEALDDQTALLMLTHVHYKSGERHDMAALTAKAHAVGALALWDLSHSVGAVRLDLNGADVDLAVGCGYKYLNGGPGAPAFLYAAERLHPDLRSPLSGWMGHAQPFAFGDDYAPAQGLDRFLCGTPPILGMAALDAALDAFDGLDMVALEAKGQALCSLFIDLVDARGGLGLQLITPRDPARRGSHVSFAHPHAYAITQALIARGVIGDFREPDVLRLGFTPLYLGYEDVWRAAEHLQDVVRTQAWTAAEYGVRARVT